MQNIQSWKEKSFSILSMTIALAYVVFLWNFWTYGVQAVGLNATFFWLAVIAFFVFVRWEELTNKSILWITPLIIIAVSFSLHTTAFTTWISILIFPVLFFVFTTHETHQKLRSLLWSRLAPVTMIVAAVHLLSSIFGPSRRKMDMPLKLNIKSGKASQDIIRQVIVGVVILVILSAAVVVPLLSSADAGFARIFTDFFDWLPEFIEYIIEKLDFLSVTTMVRIVVFGIIALTLSGFTVYWKKDIKPYLVRDKKDKSKSQAVTIGIILTGILALYILFILVQIKTLFTNALPIDFAQTESLVKTGFWQLFALTVLNILFFAGIYKKSTKIIQGILAVFTFSSLLLIISAAQRVYLYVTDYGLSYEKFFAFYTVVYCGIVFVWFLLLFVGKDRDINIIRKLVFMALWMYAITTVMPLDSIIFTTNLRLTQQSESRVNINELTMLGFDALPLVEENFDLLIREARGDYLSQSRERQYRSRLIKQQNYTEEEYLKHNVDLRWLKWVKQNIDKQTVLRNGRYINCYGDWEEGFNNEECRKFEFNESRHQQKKWYEKTFSELLYEPAMINAKFELLKQRLFEEKSIKTFKNDIQGFSIEYSSDTFKVESTGTYITDRKTLSEEDYALTIKKHNSKDYMRIESYDLEINNPSKVNQGERAKIKWIFDSGLPKTTLSKLQDTPVHAALIYGKCGQQNGKGKSYRFYIISPERLFIICSNKSIAEKIKYMDHFSSDEYIDMVAPSKDFADIIRSFQFISQN